MNIEQIFTTRKYNHWPSWDLVYEWENVFSQDMDIPLVDSSKLFSKKWFRILPSPVQGILMPQKKTFMFEMSAMSHHRPYNNKNIVSCIIDFHLKKNKIHSFEKAYKNNPITFISSREVYDYLKNKAFCKLPIAHLPLSISDMYAITPSTTFEKKYDLVLIGRTNPVLQEYLREYISHHPDFIYVYREIKNGQFLYYSSTGEYIGDISTRQQYINLMRQARCGLYSTPGIDGGEQRTKGFNQVTPRFLELIASGCHVIARYKENPDTEFYQLPDFCKNIGSYKEFEKAVDNGRDSDVPMQKYAEYLSQHYTSKRTERIKEILQSL